MPRSNGVIVIRYLLVLMLAAGSATDFAQAEESSSSHYAGCSEYVASAGYGYWKLFSIEELGRRDAADGHWEIEFSVLSKQVMQILLTTESTWPGRAGTPYEIQIYNNQVFMLNRRNRMVAKINRNYILDAQTAIPMVLRVLTDRDGLSTTTIELQVVGELQPFIRYVDRQASLIGAITHLAFGSHGPNVARYLYGCPAGGVHDARTWAAGVISAPLGQCANGVQLQSVDLAAQNDAAAGATTPMSASVPLSQLALAEPSADETLTVRLYVVLAAGQSSVRLVLHARADFGSVGSPFYAIELGDDYTLWRRGLLVATRRPNVNLLEAGQRTLVTVSITKDGTVNIWLNDLVSQTLHFVDEYPIDLRYVAFGRGIWMYARCA